MPEMTGGCLCGQVRYKASAEPALTAICHCKNCQKQAGSAFSIVVAVPESALTIQGKTKTYNDKADSGSRYRRLFAPDRGRRREHPPTPQVSPRRRDRPEDCQQSRSLGQDHRHRVGSSNSAALSMHYAVLSRWSRRCVCATRVSLGTDADFSKLFLCHRRKPGRKAVPKFRPGVSAAFRTAEEPSTRYPGIK